jgi:L-iditol 2-dehydrogenase
VAIRAVGICGSDRHYFLHGGLGSFKQKLPMAMGHEAAGVVRESKSKQFKPGDRVAIEPATHCGTCDCCAMGRQNLCRSGTFLGANGPGACADYLVVHEQQLCVIPDDMSFECAALLEPLGVALHALRRHEPLPTESVTVFGCGSIGLSVLFLLKKEGIRQIFMIDRLAYRATFAKQFGATASFTLDDPYGEHIRKEMGNCGTSLTIDAAGNDLSVNGCLEMASTGGHVILIGIPETDTVAINPHKMRIKELTLWNCRRSNRTLETCIGIMEDDRALEGTITHRFPLESLQQGLEVASNYLDSVIKCVITNDRG